MDRIHRNILIFQEDLGKLIIHIRQGLQQVGPMLGNLLFELLRDLRYPAAHSVLSLKVAGLLSDQVANACEVILLSDGQLHRLGGQTKLLPDLAEHQKGIGTVSIQLVDEDHSRNLVSLHLPVHGDRLALHSAHAAADQNSAVQDPQGALHLDGEVNVARSVDQIHVEILVVGFPGAVGSCGGNRNTFLPFQLHVVHLRPDTILPPHLVNGVNAPCVKQDALCQRRLAAVYVS
mmetsp:Transcript_19856/g.46432  ORF Transcript_19856/g.46432 Transcript_19856/m.46432 type:complete len:233 (+) Transcript_19856:1473-2171(+)